MRTHVLVLLTFLVVLGTAAENKPVRISEQTATASFDLVWEAFDEQYAMFSLREGVDWDRLREALRPKAIATRTRHDFALVAAELLRPLEDLHVSVRVGDEFVPVFNRPRPSNANPRAYRALFQTDSSENRNVEWGRRDDGIGFIAIHSWGGKGLRDSVYGALDELRDTRALILDVRLNSGGNESLARRVAGRFLDEGLVYSYHRLRNGPEHDDLTELAPRRIEPRGPWTYDKPVALLIGQHSMSSNESFIAMLMDQERVTTIGDRTAGSSGYAMDLETPAGVTVRLPRWIDYLPDKTPLEVKGIPPEVPVFSSADAFSGTKDPVLDAAIEFLVSSTE